MKKASRKVLKMVLSILIIIPLISSNVLVMAAPSAYSAVDQPAVETGLESEANLRNQEQEVKADEITEDTVSNEASDEITNEDLSEEENEEIKVVEDNSSNQESSEEGITEGTSTTLSGDEQVTEQKNNRANVEESLMDYITQFSFTDENQNPFDENNPVTADSVVNITYKFAKDKVEAKAGDIYFITFPKVFKIDKFEEFRDVGGSLAGVVQWRIDGTTNRIILRFTQDDTRSNFNGAISINTRVDEIKVTNEDKIIDFGFADGKGKFPLENTVKNVKIEKEVDTSYGNNGYKIEDHTVQWKITITPKSGSIKGLILEDNYGTLDTPQNGYLNFVAGSMSITENGRIITPTISGQGVNESGFTYTFDSNVPNGKVTIYYKTTLTEKFFDETNPNGEKDKIESASVINRASIKNDSGKALDTSVDASLNLTDLIKINKSFLNYDKSKKIISYRVVVNQERLNRGGTILDDIPEHTKLIASEVKVTGRNLDGNTVTLNKGTDYTLTDESDSKGRFYIKIENMQRRIITIDYKLELDVDNLNGATTHKVSNTASIYRNVTSNQFLDIDRYGTKAVGTNIDVYGRSYKFSLYASLDKVVNTEQEDRIKVVDGELWWPATIDCTIGTTDNKAIGNVVLQNNIQHNTNIYGGNNEMEYIPNTFKVGGVLQSDLGLWREEIWSGSTSVDLMEYSMSSDKTTETVSYRVYINVGKIDKNTFLTPSNIIIDNRFYSINGTLFDANGTEVGYVPKNININRFTPIQSDGIYVSGEEFEWTVDLNNKIKSTNLPIYLEGVKVKNSLPEGHELVEGSVSVRVKGSTKSSIDYDLAVDDAEGILNFTLKGGAGLTEEVEIVFKTKLKEGAELKGEHVNTAVVTADNMEAFESSATVTIGETDLDKTTDYTEGDEIDWTVYIAKDVNKPLLEQNIVFTDELQYGLSLKEDSVKLYEFDRVTGTKVGDAIGNKDISYSDSDRIFKYVMPDGLDLTKAYVLEFVTEIKGLDLGAKIINSCTLTGTKTEVISTSNEISLKPENASVILGGDKISLDITKIGVKETGDEGTLLKDVEFELYEKENGNDKKLATLKTSTNGMIKFTEYMEFGKTYYLKETNTPDGYVDATGDEYKLVIGSVDPATKKLTVKISKNGDSETELTLEKTIQGYYEIKYTVENIQKVKTGSIELKGTKNLTGGKKLTAGMFNFTVVDSEGNEVTTGTNKAAAADSESGAITFEPITYTEVGDHEYTIKEDDEGLGGVTYDSEGKKVTVKVTDEGGDDLVATATYPEGGLVFNNTYEAEGTSITLKGTKNLTGGKKLTAGMFNFTVVDSEGNEVTTGTNKAAAADSESGAITFEPIIYTEVGDHEYTIKEDDEGLGGVTYDSEGKKVTVKVVDNGEGALVATATYPQGDLVFNNTYEAEGTSITLTGTKNLTGGKKLTAGMFNFTVVDSEGNEVTTGTNKAAAADSESGAITFEPITYTEVGDHEYTIKEDDEGLGGVTYDSEGKKVTVKVVDNGEGALVATATYPQGDLVFNNTYEAEGTSITLKGTKNLTGGKKLTAGIFNFTVVDSEGNEVTTGTNVAAAAGSESGAITFEPITYTEAGDYEYTIKEVEGNLAGVKYDLEGKTVTVKVVDNGQGALVATATYPEGGLVFNNKYEPEGTSITLKGTKNLTGGKKLTAGMFNFTVVDSEGNEVTTGTNVAAAAGSESGAITFDPITYTEAGSHEYTVREVKETLQGIIYDEKTYSVSVEVKDNGQGALKATETYPEDGIVFTNKYNAQAINVPLTGTKNLTGGKELTAGMFNFTVVDSEGNEVTTGTNVAAAAGSESGAINFDPITYTEAGSHEYTVKEVKETLPGITYDETSYSVSVEVKVNGQGALEATVTYPEDGIVFTNKYDAQAINVPLTGTKNLTGGKELTAGMFNFTVVDSQGNEVTTGTNVAAAAGSESGAINFDPITYTEAGSHEYTVKEVKETLPGITYDETSYSVSVEVKVNGQGALEATVTYPEDGIVFTNEYNATSTDVNLTGTKNLTGGKELTAGMFNFTVEDSEGNKVATGTNDAVGMIDFTSITYTEAGTYQYSVKEETGNLPGITYDPTSYVVTVEVTDNGLGALEANVTYPEVGLVFNNTYSTDSISVAFSGKKVLTGGKELAAGMFDFTVEDGEGNVVATGTNNVIGNIDFTSITYTEAGSYHYTVKEAAGTLPGITYDPTSHVVTVEVTDNGEGALIAKVTYPEDGIVFNNSYATTSVDAAFTGQKTLTGKELTEGMFDFVVEDEEGNQVATGTNDADGKIDFTSITYTQPGVYEYTAKEVKGDTPGITYDTSVYGIKVTVVDNGLGSLVADVSYVNGAIIFENKFAEDPKDPTPPTKKPEDNNSKWNVTHVGSNNKGDKGKTSPVKTGDSTDIVFLVSVSTLSLIALSIMIYRRRKVRED